MSSYCAQYSRVGIAIYLAVFVVFSSTVSEISAQTRWKHKEHYGNLTEVSPLHNRDPKFLLAYTTLRPTVCMTTARTIGTCLTSKACTKQQGSVMGTCGMKFGTCCVVEKVCNGTDNPITVTLNGTHLRNSATFFETCRYEIPRQPGVCQVRLDFISFRIGGPVVDPVPDENDMPARDANAGNCRTDTFTMGGYTNGRLDPLCGDLTGQHMYLDYGRSDRISLDFALMQMRVANSGNQIWDIAVTMIRCDSTEKAPQGCLQYFTATTQMVRSFNYNQQQLNNQYYAVCIRSNIGMNRITWQACAPTATTTDFLVTDKPAPAAGEGMVAIGLPVPPGINPIPPDGRMFVCRRDWVEVLGAGRFCGNGFTLTSSTAKPFILNVNFDDSEAPTPMTPPPPMVVGSGEMDRANSGFCLRYSQSPN